MYTQCPGCGTVFKVHAWQLRKAGGRVGCGLCHTAFDALEGLSDELPKSLNTEGREPEEAPAAGAAREVEQPESVEVARPPVEPVEDLEVPEPEDLHDAIDEAALGGAAKETGDPARELFEQWSTDGVDFTRPARGDESARKVKRRRGGRKFLWGLGLALLLFALLLQGTYFFRDELAREPALRGWVEGVCAVLGCTVGPQSRLDALVVRERWMEEHPHREGYLLVGAVLVNEAPVSQAYPEVRVVLRDIEGDVVADRWFPPQAYVADSRLRTRLDAGMPAGREVPLRLDVESPEDGAESFLLEFREAT